MNKQKKTIRWIYKFIAKKHNSYWCWSKYKRNEKKTKRKMKTYRFVSVRIACVNITKRSIFAVYFFQLYMKTKKKLIVLSKMTKNVKISFAHKHFYRVLRRNHLFPALICIQTSGLACHVCVRAILCVCAVYERESVSDCVPSDWTAWKSLVYGYVQHIRIWNWQLRRHRNETIIWFLLRQLTNTLFLSVHNLLTIIGLKCITKIDLISC